MQNEEKLEYLDEGFGFPVIVTGVEIEEMYGEKFPKINYKDLEIRIAKLIPDQTSCLTGAEVRFVRHYLDMTLQEFGARLGVSHVAVKLWEAKGDKPAGMQWGSEKNLRLFLARMQGETDAEFGRLYDRLEQRRPSQAEPIRVSLSKTTRPLPRKKVAFRSLEQTRTRGEKHPRQIVSE